MKSSKRKGPDTVALKVADVQGSIRNRISRAPRDMTLREAVKNAIEAEPHVSESYGRECRIGVVMIDGVPKLSIWNSGLGMDAQRLVAITDFDSTTKGSVDAHGNFGVGLKLAGLAASPAGVRIRSCHDGAASEVVIWRDPITGEYGRRVQQAALGEFGDVINISAEPGLDLARDWTEVVLIGNDAAHDTTRDPFGGEPAVHDPADWVIAALRERFYHLPADFRLSIDKVLTGGKRRRLVTLGEALQGPHPKDSYTHIASANGVAIEYIAASLLPAGMETRIAIVYRGEQFDLHTYSAATQPWARLAGQFGLPHVAKQVTVLIHLPDTVPGVCMAEDRKSLLCNGKPLDVFGFAPAIVSLVPAWVKKLIERERAPTDADAARQFAALLREFKKLYGSANVPLAIVSSNGSLQVGGTMVSRPHGPPSGVLGRRKPKPKPIYGEIVPDGPRPAKPSNEQDIFKAEIVKDDAHLAELGITDFAAIYMPTTRTLYINQLHVVLLELRAAIEAEFAGLPQTPELEKRIDEVSLASYERAIVQQVYVGLVLGKRPEFVGHADEMLNRRALTAAALQADRAKATARVGNSDEVKALRKLAQMPQERA